MIITRITSLYGFQPSSVVLYIQTSVFRTSIAYLYGSQTSPVILCLQNSMPSIRITSLYGSQPSSVVFACKTATFGPELHCLAKTILLVFLSCIIQERNSVGYTVILPVLYREQTVWALSFLPVYIQGTNSVGYALFSLYIYRRETVWGTLFSHCIYLGNKQCGVRSFLPVYIQGTNSVWETLSISCTSIYRKFQSKYPGTGVP